MSDRRTPLRGNLTRRRFLQGSAMAGVAAFLAACTGTKSGTSAAPSTAAASASAAASVEASPSVAATPKVATGPLKFANWPVYIDLAGAAAEAEEYQPGSSPALEAFKKKYSIDVDYQEKIDGNDSFVQTIKPALVGGLPTGWDLVVLTDWMASKIVANNWAEKIDQTNVPTAKKNLREALRNQPWDPGNDFHY